MLRLRMTPDRHVERKPARLPGRIGKCVVSALVATLALPLANTALHMKAHVCVLHAARFARTDMLPIQYGYFPGGMPEQTGAVPVVYGGCVRGPFAAVCPHCRWPSEFVRNVPAELALDDISLAPLPPAERQRLERVAAMLLKQARGDEWITSVCITPDDVWLGTFNSGLGRMDRRTGNAESFRGGIIGDCILAIRRDGEGVRVEHEFGPTSRLCETDRTADRGRTWRRL